MKTRFLFPHSFKILGWMLLAPGIVLGFLCLFSRYEIPNFQTSSFRNGDKNIVDVQNYTQSLALALVIAGVMFVAFAKEKFEDELTAAIRYNALYWSILVNYLLCGVLMIVAIIYGDVFYDLNHILGSFGYIIGISSLNLFSTLVVFLIRYHYLLYSKKGEYKLGKLSFLPHNPYRNISKYASIILLAMFLGFKHLGPLGKYWSEIVTLLSFSLVVWIFSRQEHEDEMVTSIRMESMQLALYFNYGLLLLGDLVIYGDNFFLFMMLNLFSVQIFFLIRFELMYYKLMREMRGAKS